MMRAITRAIARQGERRVAVASTGSLSARRFIGELPLANVSLDIQRLTQQTTRPVAEAMSLHPAFYVDEPYVCAERDLIFGQHWFCAGHTAELNDPGDLKIIDVGTRTIVLTVDQFGRRRAFHTALCEHETLKSKASMTSLTLCEKADLGLREVPGVEEFLGMVFLNQSENPHSFRKSLGDLPQKLQRYNVEDQELFGTKFYDIDANWKLVAENFVDFYHIPAVHPALSQWRSGITHQAYQGPGRYICFITHPLKADGGPGDICNFNHYPGINEVEKEAALFFQIFPNVSVSLYPHSVYTLITYPGAEPGQTVEQLSMLMAPGARKAGECVTTYRRKCQALMDFFIQINDEDVEAIENLQRGLPTAMLGDISGEFLPQYDWPIHRFQNMVIGDVRGTGHVEAVTAPPDNNFERKVRAAVHQEDLLFDSFERSTVSPFAAQSTADQAIV